MLHYIDSEKMGRSVHAWLDSRHHFSFAEYYNPANTQFGDLRVLNDDWVRPGAGFEAHPHKNMEVLSYVVRGELTHEDSMGNRSSLTRGQVQYMSAGTGVFHSEYNSHADEPLRFLQIWILPDRNGYAPNYGEYRFALEERVNRWLPIAAGANNADNGAPIRVHADIYAFATILTRGSDLEFIVSENRQAYMVLIEGAAHANDLLLSACDALEITEQTIRLYAAEESHIFLIEMAKNA
ncbi:MAG: pirin family protein [Clostridiales Family XIII bacterium]|jgi:redox-sensitive bicupin YhaK (pirin superfamily)|nr:pirin family protein [Clostridiales Family XIII bacterium]